VSRPSADGTEAGGGRGISAALYGCSGTTLTAAERAFFSHENPLGFILFARNIENPDQVRALISELRAAVGRADAPVLVDQEGGRVQRLRPPHWRAAPAAATLAALGERAEAAVFLNARLIGRELADLGFTVDCAPVLDVSREETHAVIGDRAYSGDPGRVARLGSAVCRGLRAEGVHPVIKHIPGHGRAKADSHLELPRVAAAADDLRRLDFAPFRALADEDWAMTAHIVYPAFDAAAPATCSRRMVEEVIRGEIGFSGLLMSDDLSMKALAGSFADRARAALAAGCDMVLHCNGEMDEMRAVAEWVGALSGTAWARFRKAEARRLAARAAAEPLETAEIAARLAEAMG
jgi:beta-N-acetylhexosaminidase